MSTATNASHCPLGRFPERTNLMTLVSFHVCKYRTDLTQPPTCVTRTEEWDRKVRLVGQVALVHAPGVVICVAVTSLFRLGAWPCLPARTFHELVVKAPFLCVSPANSDSQLTEQYAYTVVRWKLFWNGNDFYHVTTWPTLKWSL